MKIHQSIRWLTVAAAIALGLALAAPGGAIAGQYEISLAVVEASVGPVGDTNTGEPGGVSYLIVQLTIASKEAKAAGDDAGALSKILQAEKLVVSSQ